MTERRKADESALVGIHFIVDPDVGELRRPGRYFRPYALYSGRSGLFTADGRGHPQRILLGLCAHADSLWLAL